MLASTISGVLLLGLLRPFVRAGGAARHRDADGPAFARHLHFGCRIVAYHSHVFFRDAKLIGNEGKGVVGWLARGLRLNSGHPRHRAVDGAAIAKAAAFLRGEERHVGRGKESRAFQHGFAGGMNIGHRAFGVPGDIDCIAAFLSGGGRDAIHAEFLERLRNAIIAQHQHAIVAAIRDYPCCDRIGREQLVVRHRQPNVAQARRLSACGVCAAVGQRDPGDAEFIQFLQRFRRAGDGIIAAQLAVRQDQRPVQIEHETPGSAHQLSISTLKPSFSRLNWSISVRANTSRSRFISGTFFGS